MSDPSDGVGVGNNDTTIPLIGQPDDYSGYGAPPVFLLVLLSLANLICITIVSLRPKFGFLQKFPEPMIAMMVGIFLGGIGEFSSYEDVNDTITYNFSGVFFEFFLPAIVFGNAYSVKHKSFFKNLREILCYSVLGTIISTMIIAYGIYFAYQLELVAPEDNDDGGAVRREGGDPDLVLNMHTGHELKDGKLPLVDCFILGSLLSAVDPGAALSVLPEAMDRQIYSILFGESVLNSAVAIVLYNGFREYHLVLAKRGKGFGVDAMNVSDVRLLLERFLSVTAFSIALGVGIGLTSALLLKHIKLHSSPGREQTIMVLFAYLSYLLPREMGLSPVVSLFMCGATMAHYSFYNISRMSQVATSTWFKVLGHLAETFVFVFLGASVFSVRENEWRPALAAVLIALCLVSRMVQIVCLSALQNLFMYIYSHRASWQQWLPCRATRWCSRLLLCRPLRLPEEDRAPPAFRLKPDYLSWRTQIFLSWCGLRGAVAFALALHAPVLNAEGEMLTTTVTVVLFTFIVQGSSLRLLANHLGIISFGGAEGSSFLSFHEKERQKQLIRGFSNASGASHIMDLGNSPSARRRDVDDMPHLEALPILQSAVTLTEQSSGEESSYGTFSSAWRSFDDRYMKPLFGGSFRKTAAVSSSQRRHTLEDRFNPVSSPAVSSLASPSFQRVQVL